MDERRAAGKKMQWGYDSLEDVPTVYYLFYLCLYSWSDPRPLFCWVHSKLGYMLLELFKCHFCWHTCLSVCGVWNVQVIMVLYSFSRKSNSTQSFSPSECLYSGWLVNNQSNNPTRYDRQMLFG